MSNAMRILRGGALSAALAVISVSAAHAYSDQVKKSCAGDYQNFCSQYAPESSQTRRCFEQNRTSLSKYCVTALIDAGEVPKKYRRK